MVGYTVLYEQRHIEAGVIEKVKIGYATDIETYPSGDRYSMHIGTFDGMTLLRYDNSHEATKGHEKHTAAGDTTIDYPGLESLLVQFYSESDAYWKELEGADGPDRSF
ncbi:hypothetical protein G6M89_20970 [Natronolimnobius sp. AArcel1]|uniref:toxin-antitoxin system TumE family protein n=1 Tax=Natronolimnobius sp. AArcel1 TaxID=1679093 RepID=UPI0013EAA78C|nr:DUF6516 family protein [Natronolimnobius sp. AArcel1]NGM71432.1 hypothetical protein [Natronolimnobius sp. AArcel1]